MGMACLIGLFVYLYRAREIASAPKRRIAGAFPDFTFRPFFLPMALPSLCLGRMEGKK